MTEDRLSEIEEILGGEDEPSTDEWFDMVEELITEVRRLHAAVREKRE